MKIVDLTSLGATVDAVNEALFFGQALSKARRAEAARWIAARQGLPGSYAGMFAPTEKDFAEGLTTFTGERLHTRAGTAHILGEEACRALVLLNVPTAAVQDAIKRAGAEMERRLASLEQNRGHDAGTYCCGLCTCAYWRNLLAGGLSKSEARLTAGVRELRASRLGGGRWRRFPLLYTLLALSEIDLPAAVGEMRYGGPALVRSLKRAPRDNPYAVRRLALAERVLARV